MSFLCGTEKADENQEEAFQEEQQGYPGMKEAHRIRFPFLYGIPGSLPLDYVLKHIWHFFNESLSLFLIRLDWRVLFSPFPLWDCVGEWMVRWNSSQITGPLRCTLILGLALINNSDGVSHSKAMRAQLMHNETIFKSNVSTFLFQNEFFVR